MKVKPISPGQIILRPLCLQVCRGAAIFCALRLALFGAFWRILSLNPAAFHSFGSHYGWLCYGLSVACADAFPMKERFVHFSMSPWQEGVCLGAFVVFDTLLVTTLFAAIAARLYPGAFFSRPAENFLPRAALLEGVWPPPPTR